MIKKHLLIAGCLSLYSPVAEARLGESVSDSVRYTASLGIKHASYCYLEDSKIIAEEWENRDDGWTFEEAKKLANLLVQEQKYVKLMKVDEERTLLCYKKKNVPCFVMLVHSESHFRKVSTCYNLDFLKQENLKGFTYATYKGLTFINDKVLITPELYQQIELGMERSKVIDLLGLDEGELISDSKFGEYTSSTYQYKNLFDNSTVILMYQDEKLVSKNLSAF